MKEIKIRRAMRTYKKETVQRKARICLIDCSDRLRILSEQTKDKELSDTLSRLSEEIYDLIGREIYEDRNYQNKYEL